MFDRRTLKATTTRDVGCVWLAGRPETFDVSEDVSEFPFDEELLEEIESGIVLSSLAEAQACYRRFIRLVAEKSEYFQYGERYRTIRIFERHIGKFGVTLEQIETSRRDLLKLVRTLSTSGMHRRRKRL